ncbi:MAG: hypothetical protein JXQ75_03290 [Phycisphaerae bacterium]|nr:hypothetical protein [Phycisphaerae bacterium]
MTRVCCMVLRGSNFRAWRFLFVAVVLLALPTSNAVADAWASAASEDQVCEDSASAVNGLVPSPPPQPGPRSGRSGNYLIVTAEDFSGSAPLTQFASAKTAQGFTVTTYTATAGTHQATIKNYILSLWGTPDAPDYLLIVGDAMEWTSVAASNTIPIWIGGGANNFVTDLPYVCMDGTGDWEADIPMGRIPVRLVSELQNVVDKILYVEAGVYSDPTYTERAAFIAHPDPEADAEALHDYMIDTYMTPNGIQSSKLYYDTYGARTQDVADAFNAGCFLGVYFGHSTYGQWSAPLFTYNDVDDLTNGEMHPFVMSFSCTVSQFWLLDDYEPGYLEWWLRVPGKGAAACYGPSVGIIYEWSDWADVYTFVMDSIYTDGIRELGPACKAAMARFVALNGPEAPVSRDYAECFAFLGDPSMRLPDPPPDNYLIVAAVNYVGSAPLNQFIAAKEAQGFNVSTYSVPSGTSNTTIKSYIQTLWGTADAPDYILLVGDTGGSTSTSTTIPHWTGGGSKHVATDLPYACMDAGDDWYPDIPIGRFSVTSVPMLQTVVSKSLFVEAGNFPDPDYVKRGAFLANPSTYNMAEPTHDWVIDNYFTPNDYEGIKLYSRDGADTQDVADAVNDGCLWVGYYGHSSSSGWWDPSFDQSDVEDLTNDGLYGVAWSFSCNVGNYSLPECFSETWLREADKGAAAVIFPSDYIYWGSQEAWEPSTVLEKSFFRAFFEDDIWEVAPAWQAGLYHFLEDYTGSEDIKRNFFELYNVMGDPALRLPQADGFTLSVDPESRDLCCPPDNEATYTIEVGLQGDFSETVTLDATGTPAGATVDFDVNGQVPPFTSVMTIGNLSGAATGQYNVLITGTSASKQRATSVGLSISDSIPTAPTLTSPPNAETGVSRQPTLIWQVSAGAIDYDVEVATDSSFTNIVYTATTSDTSHAVAIYLESLTEYFWHVKAINGCGASNFSAPFSFTTLDQPDYFTEEFIGGTDSFDLENFTIEFIPNGSGSFYEMCGYATTKLPSDPTGGTVLDIDEDGTDTAPLSGGKRVWLYGVDYGTLYVNDNGNITFNGGDSNWNPDVADHFDRPRVSPAFDDFTVYNGTVSWKQYVDRAVVTYEDVPEYSSSNSNTFQVEMFFDGEIHITWLRVDSNNPIVGLSQGSGYPGDYVEMNLSAAAPCFVYGACCVGEVCSIETEEDCLTATGEYQGDGTDCDPDPCADYESACLIITEVVDATLSGGCPKWIEITNTGLSDFAFLEGGVIVQTDDSSDVVVDVDLTDVTITAGQSYVVNSNQSGACTGAFQAVYGFSADLNTDVPFGDGNDRYIITDTADASNLLDIYGEFGVNGTGQSWEYTEGYSYRYSAYNLGRQQNFTAAEWYFGGPGSLNGANPEQLLLDNTTPGVHVYDEDCTGYPVGDTNCDGYVDGLDIQLFVIALIDPGQYTGCDIEKANVNGDGQIDMDDIQPFVNLLLGI